MSSGSASQNDILNQLFSALKNRTPEVRQAAARDLRRYVTGAVADMNSDASAKLWDEHINRRLFDLIHSNNSTDKLGGILAIDHLMDVDQEETIENRRNLFRFYNYLTTLLPNPDLNVMVAASKSLGKIAKIGDQVLGERFIEHEVPDSIELLSSNDKTEQSRYAGVLVLKELARNSPGYFIQHINLIFDKILLPLRDPRVHVREGAAELLAELLGIMAVRERQSRSLPFLVKLVEHSYQGLKTTQVEIIHGSLLTYRELLLHAGMAMKDSFHDTVETIFRFKAHRDNLIRRTVIALIPTFSLYDNQSFSEHFLHKAMAHLLLQLDKPSERTIAYIAIGHVAGAVGSEMKPFLDSIMHNIKMALQMRGSRKKNAPSEEPIFQCIGMLAASVGPNLTKLLHDQLDLMFACGLSEPLRSALVSIARHIPPLLNTIQDRLLDMLSNILVGSPYKPLGGPPLLKSEVAKDGLSGPSQEVITLALSTLGAFDFSGHILNEFVRDAALPYLEDDHPEVRKAAALTCCRLFVRDPICYQASNHSVEIISDVLDKLLTVGVADPDANIRQTVLQSLDDRFDKHLAQAEYVRSLFIALNDEVFTNRVLAITLIGRLAMHNPAYVMPSLRKALIQLLTELEYSTIPRSREEASRLLTLLTSATQRLIKPYALPMLRVLLPKATDANSIVAGQVLMCLGELSSVGGEEFAPHISQIMTVILATLADPAAISKREAALVTLGQLCTNTSYVISPIVDYPQLMPLLGRVLKTESSPNVRRQAIRVLGILGAIDPYRRKTKSTSEDSALETPTRAVNAVPVSHITASSGSDDYYQTVAIDALLGIMKDQSLANQHHVAVDSIMSIFKTQGLKCVSFLPQIIPAFSTVTRSSNARLQEHHLEQIAILIGIIKQHVRNYVPQVFDLVNDLWELATLQLPLVTLVEALGKALDAEFRPFLPSILPRLLKVFDGELTDKRTATQIKVFQAFGTFGANIEEYMHLVIPVIVKSYERPEGTVPLRKTAVKTIETLSQRVNFSDHASRIIHPLIRILPSPSNDLRVAVMETLCALVHQLGSDFAIFVPTINKCLVRCRIRHEGYEHLINMLLNGERLPAPNFALEKSDMKGSEFSGIPEMSKMTPNQQHLKQAWDVSQIATKEDWQDWFRKISAQFMKESPSAAIRSCMNVLDAYPQIARELFNAAFLSCWGELYEQYQDDLVRSIEAAITHPNMPPDLVHVLLNLAEFMEHEDKRLPIENRTLGEYALQFQAYAKALHYKELEFFRESTPTIVEALIGINTKLQQHDAAWGTLTVAREQYDVTKHEEWFERLGRWQEALVAYDKKAELDPHAPDVVLGRMRCLHALGEWDRLSQLVHENWVGAGNDGRREIAPLAAAAAWSLREWDRMDEYIGVMPNDSPDRSFYRAILAVHRNQFTKAANQIVKARDLLDPALTAVVGDNPGRSYNLMVRAQMLSELEEIIAYKQFADQPERQDVLRKTWRKRLQGCQPDVEVWQRILQVRALVLRSEEEPTMWIKFANLCRKNDRMWLAEKTINSLTQPNQALQNGRAGPHVVYAQLKFMWGRGDRDEALGALRGFCEALQRDMPIKPGESKNSYEDRTTALTRVLARCYVKSGDWQHEMKKGWTPANIGSILNAYTSATQYDPKWYKAWHTWSLANFEVIGYFEAQNAIHSDSIPPTTFVVHVIQAVEGFFRSIGLRNNNALQDILRLLTLWFKFGAHEDVSHAMSSGFTTVEVDTWIEVIPQIIARIQTPSVNIRRTIGLLLTDVGKHHPQALIYPLTVASKSSSVARQTAAKTIMDRMKEHSAVMVEQALVVSQELIRVAILWHELWHEGLEEASRLYFTEKNPEGMIAALEPLHEMLARGPTTIRETSFAQVFGRDLQDAREASKRFLRFGETSDLDRAWDIYYGIFRKIEKQLPQLTTLDLQYVSPELLKAKNLELAVPGTYQSGRPVIRIANFATKLTVIASKQRPRRLSLRGDDGRDYQYILKGHEDLRQDERVMQLFSLVNTLLSVDTNSFKRRLHIQRYPVIPLAPNAGLLGWVEESDTLHVLVRDYRDARKILLNLEYRLMLQMAPDYEFLTLLQKVEVFEYALDNTTGQDLYRMLWLRSVNSEAWLDRRATYTRSLAVNSMVGHILGLGDRHPSNILIERATGKVVHIDFGDCFEVAMHREKFPETVPFRLTRMLTHAMEVSGIQGSFRNTCEITMRVVRANKDSLMAVLEAFVYDPLISWRLMRADAEHLARAGYPQGPIRKIRADENEIFNDAVDDMGTKQEVRNERALNVFNRVQHKLTGRDFDPNVALTIEAQVDRLIQEATSLENLCQCFSGWLAYFQLLFDLQY
ncbi:phosphatidylinositol 3-kinase [Hysterangium stoloniferum]|nr:phosphatidylinositol 3-kinase [Hysterangium stoloniferum]